MQMVGSASPKTTKMKLLINTCEPCLGMEIRVLKSYLQKALYAFLLVHILIIKFPVLIKSNIKRQKWFLLITDKADNTR